MNLTFTGNASQRLQYWKLYDYDPDEALFRVCETMVIKNSSDKKSMPNHTGLYDVSHSEFLFLRNLINI